MREIRELMDAAAIQAAIAGIAERIAAAVSAHRDVSAADLAFVGIRRRGAPLAQRIAREVARRLTPAPDAESAPIGELDITLYRDDLSQKADQPVIGVTNIPFQIDGKALVLVDDVFFTGRTIRAALTALTDYGRPRVVWLAELVDRGWRELPIHPDFVGLKCETARNEIVEVKLREVDDQERVVLVEIE